MPPLSQLKDKTILYFKDSYSELKKVVWPTRQEIIQHTVVVIVMSVAVAIFLGVLDLAFSKGIQQLLFLKK